MIAIAGLDPAIHAPRGLPLRLRCCRLLLFNVDQRVKW
jgi:hypothetical protein